MKRTAIFILSITFAVFGAFSFAQDAFAQGRGGAPTLAFSSNKSSVITGRDVDLTWLVSNVNTCAKTSSPAHPDWNSSVLVTSNGSTTDTVTNLTTTTDFTIQCSNSQVGISETITVAVTSESDGSQRNRGSRVRRRTPAPEPEPQPIVRRIIPQPTNQVVFVPSNLQNTPSPVVTTIITEENEDETPVIAFVDDTDHEFLNSYLGNSIAYNNDNPYGLSASAYRSVRNPIPVSLPSILLVILIVSLIILTARKSQQLNQQAFEQNPTPTPHQ